MEFTQSVTYPGTVDEVVAMFLSPGYQERRFGSFLVPGSTTASVEGGRITFSGDVRPELIPRPPPVLSRAVCEQHSWRSGRRTRPWLVRVRR